MVFLALGLACLSLPGVEAAGLLFPIRLALFHPHPAPHASPDPNATPVPPPRPLFGNGPIVVRGEGNLQAGVFHSTRSGIGTDSNRYSGAMVVTLERRTENATVSLSQPMGYQSGASSLGQLSGRYVTGKYSFTYGLLAGPSETQLDLGGFARGVGLVIPRTRGEVALYASAANRNSELFRVLGARRLFETRRGTLTLTAFDERGTTSGGGNTIADLAFLAYGTHVSSQAELAVSRSRGLTDMLDGTRVAGGLHFDASGTKGFGSLTLRYLPDGFATLQQSSNAQLETQLTVRRDLGRIGSATLDLGHTDTRDQFGTVDHAGRGTLSFSRPLFAGSLGLIASLAGDDGTQGPNLLQQTGLTLSQNVGKLALTGAVQTSSTRGSRGDAAQREVTLGAARELLGGSFSYAFTHARVDDTGDDQLQDQHQLLYQHQVGRKLDAGASLSFERNIIGGIASLIRSQTLTLTRRFSPVVALQVAAGRTQQTGPGGGTATTFSATILGPLSFGETAYGGRANPNLPATIRGSVTTIYGDAGLGSSRSRAANNVLVVLDGRVSQRTDVNGAFEFRFVKPGAHVVSLESGTIPPGLIPDSDTQSVRVQGGQIANVSFAVGFFAGVSGYVLVEDNGKKMPIEGVSIAVDGVRGPTTGTDGHYSVGRLTPGPHKISVVQGTLPTTVILADAVKTAQVATGISTRVDFVGTRLGAISGTVLFAGDGGFGEFLPAANVYVVAQPGDHAAITDDQGQFILDNLPPGKYALDVDKETTPDGQGVVSGPDGPVEVSGGETLSGIVFKLGAAGKNVVYTFDNGQKKAVAVETHPQVVPPGALLEIVARPSTGVRALSVHSDVFGSFPLRRVADGAFGGAVVVPPLAKGDYALSVGDDGSAEGESLVTVDPTLPLVTVRTVPAHPAPGARVRVRATILAPVEQGDPVRFSDGETVRLPKPNGRVFIFDVRLARVPDVGEITSKMGVKLPISIR